MIDLFDSDGFVMKRRSFLAGLFVAPAIIKSSSLMPVRSLILPEHKLLTRRVVTVLEASYDGKEWFFAGRALGKSGASSRPMRDGDGNLIPYHRAVIQSDWKPYSPQYAMEAGVSVPKVARRYQNAA